MKKSIIINAIVLIAFIFFVIWKFNTKDKEIKELSNRISEEYGLISLKDSINTRILNIYEPPIFRKNPNIIYIATTSDSVKYTVAVKYCINSKDVDLEDVLTQGDNIIKNSDSDTLYVTKNKDNYQFKMKLRK